MHRRLVCILIVLCMTSPLCFARVAKANLISNGNFSAGTLAGWVPGDNVVATDYATMPQNYKNTWDLSSWNACLDGSFALFENQNGRLSTKIANESGFIPTSLSLDYAVAWADPKIPDAAGNPYAYGYFYVQTFGVAADNRNYSLTFNEKAWLISDPAIGKGVFTGTLYTDNFAQRPDLVFKEILLDIYLINPNGSLKQIIGIDNVNMSVPTPEPSALILLGLGLAGIAGIMRNMKRI